MVVPLAKLEDLKVGGKVVLVRVDLNVPMTHGKVDDTTRITRLAPTLNYLIQNKAKVVVLSHFGRPKGTFVREMSLAPLADALGKVLEEHVHFALDCIGATAKDAIDELQEGQVLLLENLRFHKGEEVNDADFIEDLAALGDCYVNDTFSCSHREHASIVGLAKALPSAAGFLLQDEIKNLEQVLEYPDRPIVAIVGGSKVSTKLNILHNLIKKVDVLVIGGAMANTFLYAQGHNVGKSLYEPELKGSALEIIEAAEKLGCEIFIPHDVVTAKELAPRAECAISELENVAEDDMILDMGPDSIAQLQNRLKSVQTVIWNGPLGAFEVTPFGTATVTLARTVASLTKAGKIVSVGGGGDVVASLGDAGLQKSFSYISTAGGAFLEWLEGKELPGVAVLRTHQEAA